PTPPPASGEEEKADITLSFEQMPLPGFIQVVYATILKKNVNLDPKVVERKDLVTLRTGAPQTPSQAESTVRLLLKSYGIAVVDIGGLIRVVPDTASLGYLPEIRRGRALPETPLPLRPIFQLVELQAVKNSDVASWIRIMFANKVDVKDDSTRNALLLSGKSDDVMAALEAVHVLDQPLMKGRQSVRVTPAFWSVDDLAKKLAEILQAEGYNAGTTVSSTFPITLLPVPSINALIVFAANQPLLDHVNAWITELDKSNERSTGRNLFSYEAQNIDAQALAVTLEKLLGGPVAAAARPPGTAAGAPAAPARPPGKVVVDQSSNTLIFQGFNEDYGQIRSLLQRLDKPAKEALIEVTVAEVTLTDSSQLGIEWLIKEARLEVGTLGGLSLGSAGFNYRRFDSVGDAKILLNALASSNQATILSTPRVVARNGETAVIQVGQEVPIITSQQVAPTTGGTTTTNTTLTVPQSIQYRNTGVILTVKPVIHSGDQVGLEISQEVSSAAATTTGVSTSPTFSTRKVQTKLSLKNGATVLLGGLISSSKSEGNAGIPLLKDVPVLGQLFRTNTGKNDRTELIVLITPYIISGDEDAQAVTNAFRSRLGGWAQPAVPAVGVDQGQGRQGNVHTPSRPEKP
ncbi:MAG: hypothetical protein A3H27_10925, partial [Acidobacteria bacterium RIFCSPLOWO2_02_FULL_59_13]